jgi:acyl transferase domain-containing protein
VPQLAAAERRLRTDGVRCMRTRARQAFHSPVVADAVAKSAGGWDATPLRAPRRTLYSAYLGGVLPGERARDPRFWAGQPAEPVLFGPTLDRLLGDGDFLLVEAGPRTGLSALARRHPAVTAGRSAVIAMLPAHAGDPDADRRAVRAAADRIRAEGHRIAAGPGSATA